MSAASKVIARRDRQTDRHTHTHRHDENITSTTYGGDKKKLYTSQVLRLSKPPLSKIATLKKQFSEE